MAALEWLFDRIVPLPEGFVTGQARPLNGDSGTPTLNCLDCHEWSVLLTTWKKALKWRAEMTDVLAVAMAVCLSTEQVGDQLFLMMIGSASSGKTRFCDAMLTSPKCKLLEHITGFHSGWKDGSGEDFSLIDRINRMTLITPEGDVMMSNPAFIQVMSQARRIFDGSSSASYKNSKEDKVHSGLRTPWIMAGTPALLSADQSRLGDRFLKVFIDPPSDDEREAILRRVVNTALQSVRVKSEETSEGQISPRLGEAYSLTGGYINYLRDNSSDLLSQVIFDDDQLYACGLLGEFTRHFRARPHPDVKKDDTPNVEEPHRLAHQFVRLACCLAVVLNKDRVDEEVMRITKKVALDTSRGITLQIAHALYQAQPDGFDMKAIENVTGRDHTKIRVMLKFLRQIGVVEINKDKITTGAKTKQTRYRLTSKMYKLYTDIGANQ